MNATSTGVRVELFGPFSLRDEQGRSIKLPARSAALLLAYLALHPSGVARAEVAAALWPDSDPELARSALRTAIHRARSALGDEAITDDGRLRLGLATDVAEAVRLQRARRHAANADEALSAAWAEWNIVRRDLLFDWGDEWIEPLREDARHQAYECGGALARLLEERGEREKALEVLDGILGTLPHHAEALEHAMRLENALKGREAALARVAEARRSLSQTVGMALPDSIQKLERMIRRGTSGYLPPPAAFSNGQDLSLIGHMFEANLRHGGSAALATLAEEAFSPICLRHPFRTFDLLRRAIALTEGFGPERTATITAAIEYALFVGDEAALHELCDMLIAAFPSDHRLHNGSLSVKGFAFLRACDFASARTYLQRAYDDCEGDDRKGVALGMLGFVDWHELEFDLAISRIREAIETLNRSGRENRHRNLAGMQAELCLIHAARGDWSSAIESGFAARSFTDVALPTTIIAMAPLGLALVFVGRAEEGVPLLRQSLAETYRERMPNAQAVALDAAAIAMSRLGDRPVAEAILDAATAVRRRLGQPRSPGETLWIETQGKMNPDTVKPSPLRLQSPGSLAEWLGEALERATHPNDKVA